MGHDMCIVIGKFREEVFLGKEFKSMAKKFIVNSR